MKILMYMFIFIGIGNSLNAMLKNNRDLQYPVDSAKQYLKYYAKSIKHCLDCANKNHLKEDTTLEDYAFLHNAYQKNHDHIESIKYNVARASIRGRSQARSYEQLHSLRIITTKNATNKFNTLLEYAALSTNQPHTSQ